MLTYSGGCHCGNISFAMELACHAGSYEPRACDCSFCRAHAASYVSDPLGKLDIYVRDAACFGTYHQGSGIADFLLCKMCGVLVGVSYRENGRWYATINSKAVSDAVFGEEIVVSPKRLNDQDKVKRWKEAWFRDVSLAGVV